MASADKKPAPKPAPKPDVGKVLKYIREEKRAKPGGPTPPHG